LVIRGIANVIDDKAATDAAGCHTSQYGSNKKKGEKEDKEAV
jgi:hypothetical protein